MRFDTRISRDTRIEVVTEGVLTRLLQSDPALEGVAAVIFDEFHERSLQADLGVALALDAREHLTPELRLLVMSATLDGAAVARLLDDAPLVTAHGRIFPVQTRYAGKGLPALPEAPSGRRPQESPERLIAQLVSRALHEERGDVLVFLPGAGEIRRVQSRLSAAQLGSGVQVLPLFGELASWGARDAAALRWLDPPPAAQLGSARDLLERLGALDSAAGITAHGRELTRVAAHPRLAHMLLRARVLGALPLAAQLAALLSERDLLRAGAGTRDADIRARLEVMCGEDRAAALDRPALQRARRAARDLERQADESGGPAGAGRADTGADPGLLLAFAYPDRIGRKRAGGVGRFVLANGRGA